MQMPIMAKAVFIARFIASGAISVKAESGGAGFALLQENRTPATSFGNRAELTESPEKEEIPPRFGPKRPQSRWLPEVQEQEKDK